MRQARFVETMSSYSRDSLWEKQFPCVIVAEVSKVLVNAVTGQADLRATVRSHGVYRKLPVLSHLPERPPQFSLSVPMTLVRRFRRSISQSFSSTGQVLGLWLHLAQLPRSLERESLPLSFWLLRS